MPNKKAQKPQDRPSNPYPNDGPVKPGLDFELLKSPAEKGYTKDSKPKPPGPVVDA